MAERGFLNAFKQGHLVIKIEKRRTNIAAMVKKQRTTLLQIEPKVASQIRVD